MRFSEEIKDSPTLKLGELARSREQSGHKIINLAIGEPDFKTPNYIIEATKKALDDGYTGYSTPQGLVELRRAISKEYKDLYNASYDESEIIIFPGAKNAIFSALASLLEEDDEVIIISPYYVSYPPMIKLAEVSAKIVDIPLNKDLSLPLDLIKKHINNKTKVLILNYPNNPTGKLLTKNEILEVVSIIKEHDIYLLSDEIYARLPLFDNQFISFSKFPEIKDKLVVVDGYSKTYAMTGFRIGYILSSKEIVRKLNLINQNTNTNTNTFVQKGVLSIYENKNTHLEKYILKLEERIVILEDLIKDIPFMEAKRPESSFYYFIDISKSNLKSEDFATILIEKGVVVTPGIAFGSKFDNYIRISLATSKKHLIEAFKIIKTLKF